MTITQADTDTIEIDYAASEVACQDCGKPAAVIGTGHRNSTECPITPAPPWFKCRRCFMIWYHEMLHYVVCLGYEIECADCGLHFGTDIDEFSAWRPV